MVQRFEHNFSLLAKAVLQHDLDGGHAWSHLPVADLQLELIDQAVLLLALLHAAGSVLFVQIDTVQMLRKPSQQLVGIAADLLPFVIVTVVNTMHLTHQMPGIVVAVALERVRQPLRLEPIDYDEQSAQGRAGYPDVAGVISVS